MFEVKGIVWFWKDDVLPQQTFGQKIVVFMYTPKKWHNLKARDLISYLPIEIMMDVQKSLRINEVDLSQFFHELADLSNLTLYFVTTFFEDFNL